MTRSRLAWLSPGAKYMVAAAFFFSVMSVCVKLAGQRLPSSEIVFARCIVSLVLGYFMVRGAGVPLWGHRKSLLILRGVLGFSALMCFFYSLTKLPLADVTVIHFTNPVFTAILAAIFLRERTGWREIAALGTSLVGVTLVARPSFIFGSSGGDLDLFAVGIALLGAVLSAGAYTAVRKLRESEHPLVIVFYFPLVGTPIAVPVMAQEALLPIGFEWLLLIGVGVSTQIAQVFLTKGLHSERAGRAMSISYVQIIFAAAWGMLFFSEYPSTMALIGAVLVVLGTVFIAGKSDAAKAPIARTG